MAAAATLTQAGKQAWANLTPFAVAGTLRTKILAFCATTKSLFPESEAAGHPVANWNAILYAFGTNMAATAGEYPLLRIAADYVYRLCLMGAQLTAALPAQTAALLVAYNANF